MSRIEFNSWRGVHAEILRRIHDGEWPPGSMLPGEADLARELGCARATVNRAMRELASAGLVERRRKAGTRVAMHPVSRVVLDIPIIRLEVEQRGYEWKYSLLEQKIGVPPLSVTSRLGLPRDSRMLHVSSMHYADNHPFVHEDRWINLAVLPDAKDVDFAVISSNEWLVQNAPYTGGDISFWAQNAGAAAELLDLPESAAVLVVDRITWNLSGPVTCVRLAYAQGYRMHAKL